jgi:hypothetical protein
VDPRRLGNTLRGIHLPSLLLARFREWRRRRWGP